MLSAISSTPGLTPARPINVSADRFDYRGPRRGERSTSSNLSQPQILSPRMLNSFSMLNGSVQPFYMPPGNMSQWAPASQVEGQVPFPGVPVWVPIRSGLFTAPGQDQMIGPYEVQGPGQHQYMNPLSRGPPSSHHRQLYTPPKDPQSSPSRFDNSERVNEYRSGDSTRGRKNSVGRGRGKKPFGNQRTSSLNHVENNGNNDGDHYNRSIGKRNNRRPTLDRIPDGSPAFFSPPRGHREQGSVGSFADMPKHWASTSVRDTTVQAMSPSFLASSQSPGNTQHPPSAFHVGPKYIGEAVNHVLSLVVHNFGTHPNKKAIEDSFSEVANVRSVIISTKPDYNGRERNIVFVK